MKIKIKNNLFFNTQKKPLLIAEISANHNNDLATFKKLVKAAKNNGADLIILTGTAYSDQDILKLISNLNNKKLISQASLATMTLPQGQQGSQQMKGFKIACILEQV